MKEAFAIFDKSGKGIINLQDMLTYLQGLRVNEKYFTIYSMIQKLAREFPKGISVKEFLEHVQWMFGDIETGSYADLPDLPEKSMFISGMHRSFNQVFVVLTQTYNLLKFEQGHWTSIGQYS